MKKLLLVTICSLALILTSCTEATVEKGTKYMKDKKYDKAIEVFNAILEEDETNYDAWFGIVKSQIKDDEYEDAGDTLEQLFEVIEDEYDSDSYDEFESVFEDIYDYGQDIIEEEGSIGDWYNEFIQNYYTNAISSASLAFEEDNEQVDSDVINETPVIQKVIKVGIDNNFLPFEYINENNELVGIDIDFANALSEQLGVEFEYVPTAFDGIFVGLTEGNYDCIISSVSLTSDLLETYELSIPYFYYGYAVVVAAGDESIKTKEDLAGKKVGVQVDTTADLVAQKQSEITPFDIIKYDSLIETVFELNGGRIDCVVVNLVDATIYFAHSPEVFTITSTLLNSEPLVIVYNKGDLDLKETIDLAIMNLQESGVMNEISTKWFDVDFTFNIKYVN